MKIYGLQDWQILQQIDGLAEVKIFGECEECETGISAVSIQITEEESGKILMPWTQTECNAGKWYMLLDGFKAGIQYRIDIDGIFGCGENQRRQRLKESVRHVSVGDIYLIAGQSNAAGWSRGCYDEPLNLNVRELNHFGQWSVAAQPLEGGGFSPFITFAKILSKKLNYPVGLIPRAIGASSVTSWTSSGEYIQGIHHEKIGKIKGVLWYQGCNEALENNTEKYEEYFIDFVKSIRRIFQNQNLPIITFQLNRFIADSNPKAHNEGYDKIREIQRNMIDKIKNLYIIPTIDLTLMSDAIHNSIQSNITIGKRAAELSLDEIYHMQISDKAPNISDAVIIADNKIKLTFDNVKEELYAFEVSAENLPIAIYDKCGINRIIKYEISKNIILLTTERNPESLSMVKAQFGKNPSEIIIDHDTMLPILCFSDVKLSKTTLGKGHTK